MMKMKQMKTGMTRREFFKLSGVAGMGSIVTPMGKLAHAANLSEQRKQSMVPRRPFGKTGQTVSILGLGGSQDLMSKQLLLRQAIKLGETYWDTANSYDGGNSEKAIGKYLMRFPEDRKSIFLVTKSSSSNPKYLTQDLARSLERLKTDYIDMYFVHHVYRVKDDLIPEVKAWAEQAKASGQIRFFGFSTHSNMAQCMLDASKLGWIDGIMASYNYRLMNSDEMKKAVAACETAGIGLTAMKTQARFSSYFYSDHDKKDAESQRLADHFMAQGFTPEQAKLKAVWDNPAIASICSEMPNMTILQANVDASVDRTTLSYEDKRHLERYARRTAHGYCAGCGSICESALRGAMPISDIMRCLMYANAYEKPDLAADLFQKMGSNMRQRVLGLDFSQAEQRCPQKMPIAKLMKQAAEKFALS